MCGIAGFAFGPHFRPSEAYVSLLVGILASAMDARGGDSFGIAKLNKEGQVKLWKGLGKAAGNINLPAFKHTSQLMLHTRKKTHGAVSLDNAHPVQQGHILGCHNGIVSNHDELNRKYKREFALDSRHIFEQLARGLPPSEIKVYGAISYLDLNAPDVINLCKLSSSGDLYIVGLGSASDVLATKGIIYCSSMDPMRYALNLLQEKYFNFDVPEKKRFYIKDGVLRIDHETKMDFSATQYTGAQFSRATALTRGGTEGAFKWEPPTGFRACKPCKKAIKKSHGWFRSVELCTPCWKLYQNIKFPPRSNLIGGTSSSTEDVGKKNSSTTLIVQEVRCHFCAKGHFAWWRGKSYCSQCWSELDFTAREGSSVGGGHDQNQLPLELEQWDLCTLCAYVVVRNGKWATHSFCDHCRAKWAAMLQDLKMMDRTERGQWAQVVQCSVCKIVPTFGWPYKQAYADDGKVVASIATCTTCGSRCSRCGGKTPKMIYSARRDGQGKAVPFCTDCYGKKTGEVVELREKEKSATGGILH